MELNFELHRNEEESVAKEKLPPDIKDKWVSALRGGEYVQTRNQLYSGEDEQGKYKMCCLGVLEHICGTDLADIGDKVYPLHLSNPKSKLSQSTCRLFGKMNDGIVGISIAVAPHTFEEIAEFIEEYL